MVMRKTIESAEEDGRLEAIECFDPGLDKGRLSILVFAQVRAFRLPPETIDKVKSAHLRGYVCQAQKMVQLAEGSKGNA